MRSSGRARHSSDRPAAVFMTTMHDMQLPRSHALGLLLEEGVRYERAGVVSRAQESFLKLTRRADEDAAAPAEGWWRLANLYRLPSSWDDALDASRRSIA